MSATANRVALATTSELAADAAAEIADLGGNAVDCGIAAAMCSINTQPGVCALAGSAYVTIWGQGDKPITIDGNVAVPGAGLPAGTKPLLRLSNSNMVAALKRWSVRLQLLFRERLLLFTGPQSTTAGCPGMICFSLLSARHAMDFHSLRPVTTSSDMRAT